MSVSTPATLPSSSSPAPESGIAYERADPTCAPPSSPNPSLYVTFKVLRLVNAFRQRVKTRVRSRAAKRQISPGARQDFCQVFERQALEEVDYYLGKKKARHHRKALPTLKRECDFGAVANQRKTDKRIER